MIKAIIFDIGGVVLKPKSFHPVTQEYAKMMNLEKDRVHEIFKKIWYMWRVDEINENEFFDKLTKELKIQADKEKLRKIFYSVWELDEGTFEMIGKLRKNYKIFALTNQSRELFSSLSKEYGLSKIFDKIFTSYETKLAKPDPKIYEYMLGKTGMKPGECVFIDDKDENVERAGKLGMKALLFENAEQTENELRKLGVNF